jgi:hypothetical protein
MRAEKWLLRVYKEIEDKFFNPNAAQNPGQVAPRSVGATRRGSLFHPGRAFANPLIAEGWPSG